MPKDRLKAHVNTFVTEKVAPLLYPEVVCSLQQHQKDGWVTVLNTASPDIYARAIAEYLGFHHCFATNVDLGPAEEPNMPFFPKIIGPNNKREAKLEAMAELLPPDWRTQNVAPIPSSAAYSDSHVDLPMLRLAETAVMIHPTAELAAEGNAKGWETRYPVRPFTSRLGYRIACFRQAFGL